MGSLQIFTKIDGTAQRYLKAKAVFLLEAFEINLVDSKDSDWKFRECVQAFSILVATQTAMQRDPDIVRDNRQGLSRHLTE